MNDLREYMIRIHYRGKIVGGACRISQPSPLELTLDEGTTSERTFAYWGIKGSNEERYRPRDVQLDLVNILGEVVVRLSLKKASIKAWDAQEAEGSLLQTWSISSLTFSCTDLFLL